MKEQICAIALRYKALFTNKSFVISLIVGFLLLAISIGINYLASLYATDRASNPVTDLILSNIPVFNVDDIFVYGPIIFWVIMGIVCLASPKKIPFILKSIALFVVIRSAFITLTHIGLFPDHSMVDTIFGHASTLPNTDPSNNFFIFSAGGDLFFSAHTGLPFLMALCFWREKIWRYFCLLSSVFFGVVVLLGHLHYSIDVMSAFFITYSIYHIAEKWFRKDRGVFYHGLGAEARA